MYIKDLHSEPAIWGQYYGHDPKLEVSAETTEALHDRLRYIDKTIAEAETTPFYKLNNILKTVDNLTAWYEIIENELENRQAKKVIYNALGIGDRA